jgi:O-antigen/teichoic acid export membrane protein
LAGSRILAMASTVLIAPVLVDQLGPAQFGVWAVVLAAVGLITVLGSGGDLVAARVIAEHRAEARDTRVPVVVAIALAGAEAAIFAAALIAFAPTVVDAAGIAESAQPEAADALRWIALAYVFQRVAHAAAGCLSGLERNRARALVDTAAPLAFALAGTAVLLSGGDLVGLALVYCITAAAAATAATATLTTAPRGSAVGARATLGTLWSLGRPRQFSHAAFAIALLAERALVSQFGGEIAAGRYAAASTLVAAAVVVLLYALNPLGPRFVNRVTTDGPQALRSDLRDAERSAALLAGAALGALAACGTPLMAAWVGPQLEGAEYIAILAPGYFAWLIARVGFHAAAAVGEPWIEARTAAVAAALNVIGALLVLELFGVGAAGVATSASLLLWAGLFARASRTALGTPPARDILTPGIAAAAIAAALAIGGRLLLAPDDGSRWGQAAMAAALALVFLALYTAAMSRWRTD